MQFSTTSNRQIGLLTKFIHIKCSFYGKQTVQREIVINFLSATKPCIFLMRFTITITIYVAVCIFFIVSLYFCFCFYFIASLILFYKMYKAQSDSSALCIQFGK